MLNPYLSHYLEWFIPSFIGFQHHPRYCIHIYPIIWHGLSHYLRSVFNHSKYFFRIISAINSINQLTEDLELLDTSFLSLQFPILFLGLKTIPMAVPCSNKRNKHWTFQPPGPVRPSPSTATQRTSTEGYQPSTSRGVEEHHRCEGVQLSDHRCEGVSVVAPSQDASGKWRFMAYPLLKM